MNPRSPSLRVFSVFVSALFMTLPVCARQGTGFYRSAGTEIVDPDGNPVVLKGIGLGGWLMPEGYMLHISAPDGGSPRTIRARIEDLIGKADTDQFFQLYRANYVQEKDIEAIASWGFDHIRLPFHFDLFYDSLTGTFREEGFQLLDTFLDWCRTHNLPVILDMHAAPGAQSAFNIADSDGEARLWTEPVPYQDQTVALWTEIARRYADDPIIIGFDLINEPVTPDGITGFDLRALYERIATAIRTVDSNHILFIEGNFYATHFPELIPPFDDNMVYSFHKYWNGTGVNSIQYLLDIRAQTNVPLWLGETGENSNVWFYFMQKLMDENRIGWNFWTHKKIQTTTSPRSAPYVTGYKDLVEYWNGTRPRPSATVARDALFNMARGLNLDSTEVRPGVLASLLDPDYPSLRRPFKAHVIPGIIHAVDYDIGDNGVTYADTDLMATTGSPGGGNNGRFYRNDGVDIEPSQDPSGFDFNVGWTDTFEWLSYSVNVESTGRYDVEFRVASQGGGGQFQLLMDEILLGGSVTAPNTGAWQNWTSVWLRDIPLTQGDHILKFLVRFAGFNINQMRFIKIASTGSEQEDNLPDRSELRAIFPNPATDTISVSFAASTPGNARIELFDMLGRRVYAKTEKSVGAGSHVLNLNPDLAPGAYQLRMTIISSAQTHVFSRGIVVRS